MKKILKFGFLVSIFLFLSSCQVLGLSDDVVSSVEGDEIFLYSDGFTQPESGWDRYKVDFGTISYVNEAYEIHLNAAQHFLWGNPKIESPQNVRVKVDVEKIDGENDDFFGVLCRYQNENNFYALIISGDGYAGIYKRENGSELISVTGDTMLPRNSIRQGFSINSLQVDCVGTHLALFVNDELVMVVKDETFSPANALPGDVGLIAGTFGATQTTIQFSDFQVFEAK